MLNSSASKRAEAEGNRNLRLDRVIRESMRKCYRAMKLSLEAADTDGTGDHAMTSIEACRDI